MNRSSLLIAFACIACGGSTGSGGVADGGFAGGGAVGGSGVGGSGVGGSGAVGGSGLGGSGALGGSGGVGATGGSGVGGVGCTLPPGQTLGTYRLALAVTLAPTKPILYEMQASTTNDAAPRLSLVGPPLDAQDRVTPVGPPLTLLSDPIDGTLHVPPTFVLVPGAANPITGSDIEVTADLTGVMCGVLPSYCGDLTGDVTKPITLDLAGSHFTLEVATAPEIHVDCDGTVAEPPGG